jgi:hypothetical protein
VSLLDCLPSVLFAGTIGLFALVIAGVRARRGRTPDAPHTQPLPSVAPLAPLTDENRAMLTRLRARPAIALDVAYARGEAPQGGEYGHD